MQENKVVIKINYDKPQWNQPLSSPALVTVWHVRRIVIAALLGLLALGVLLAWILGFWQSEAVAPQRNASANTEAVVLSEVLNNNNKPLDITAEKSALPVSHKPVFSVYDKRVIQSFLNLGAFSKHPYKSVKSSIVVSPSKSVEVFYLTKLQSHTHGGYYHRWHHQTRGDIRPPMVSKQHHTKWYSAKTLTAADLGEWTVQLLDSNDVVLSEVKFWVSLE